MVAIMIATMNAPVRGEPAVTLTLAQAIDRALSDNPELAIADQARSASEAQVRATAARRLPRLALSASARWWDRPIVAELAIGSQVVTVDVRDQLTGSIDLSVTQPVTGAFVIGTLVARDRAASAAATAARDQIRIDAAYRAAAAYLEALEATALAEVAVTTLRQLDAAQRHARALITAGTLQAVDALRIDVERAVVEQQRLAAEAAALAARRSLGLLLGVPDGSELALVALDLTPPELPWTEDAAVARAGAQRPERRGAAAQREIAAREVSVARASYYPSVSLVGVYSHAITAGSLDNAYSAYAGVQLDWNLWDWGKRAADLDAAVAADRGAVLRASATAAQIAASARTAWHAARIARATIDVAAAGLTAAVETQRVQAARFAQGAATTVELLDAETALATARAHAAISRYRYLVAWMALGRAVGEVPALDRSARGVP